MSFEMIPIPSEKVRGWKVSVDGVSLPNASFVVIESQRYGKFVYGLRPEGYDSMVYIEPGGGGSVTLPFSYNSKAGELLGVDRFRRIHMCIHEIGQPGDVVLGFGAGFEVHVPILCPATTAVGRVRQRARNGHIRQDGNRTRLCVEEESWPTTHVWIGPTQ